MRCIHIEGLINRESIKIYAILVKNTKGSHQTLLELLSKQFKYDEILVDGIIWNKHQLESKKSHDIQIFLKELNYNSSTNKIRETIKKSFS